MFLFNYTNQHEDTKPLVDLLPIERTCKELSEIFHWDVTVEHKSQCIFVYRNGTMIFGRAEEDYSKNVTEFCDTIDRIVRSYANG